jgi:hypothetical protein
MVKKRLKKLHAKDALVEMHHCFLDLLDEVPGGNAS